MFPILCFSSLSALIAFLAARHVGGSDESDDEAEDTTDNLNTPERELHPPLNPKAPSMRQQQVVGW